MIPGEYTNSDYWCRWCQKRMVAEYGQRESDGELVEHHACLQCGRTYTCAPERRSLDLPESRPEVLWATLQQYLEIRLRHVDRPEFLRGLNA